MHYCPLSSVTGVPHVLIHGTGRPDSAVVLSQGPGVVASFGLRGDTATELALALLRLPERERRLAGIDVVSTEQFDLDALLAVWALVRPEEALRRAEQVVEAARAGAFSFYTSDIAAQFVCLFRGVLAAPTAPDGRSLQGLDRVSRGSTLFEALIPLVAAMLDDIRRFDEYWYLEYTDVIRSNALRYSGAVQVEELPALDLAILETPLDLHDLTRLSCSPLARLLTIRSENTYILEYRRESWVQYQSRRVMPRIDLKPLAARFALFERFPGRWRAEPLDQPVSRLYLDGGQGPAPSSLDRETVVAEVIDYLVHKAGERALEWSPYDRH